MIEKMKNMKLPITKSVAFLPPPKTARLSTSSISSSIGNIEVVKIKATRNRTPEMIKEVQVKIGKVLDRISPRGRNMVKKNPLKYKMYWEDQAMQVMKSLVPK